MRSLALHRFAVSGNRPQKFDETGVAQKVNFAQEVLNLPRKSGVSEFGVRCCAGWNFTKYEVLIVVVSSGRTWAVEFEEGASYASRPRSHLVPPLVPLQTSRAMVNRPALAMTTAETTAQASTQLVVINSSFSWVCW